MYTEIREGRRQVIRDEITHVDVRALVEELKYKRMGDVFYLLGDNIKKGVVLEVTEDKKIKVASYIYDFIGMYIRNTSGLKMEGLDNRFLVEHLIIKTRDEWAKVNNN